jgi:hypothetical protein
MLEAEAEAEQCGNLSHRQEMAVQVAQAVEALEQILPLQVLLMARLAQPILGVAVAVVMVVQVLWVLLPQRGLGVQAVQELLH